jgi:DMSO/TMAO reductase YedYZ molybdopterin-dependent catalytic subunit
MSDPRRSSFVAGVLAAGAAVLVISLGRIVLGPPGFLDTISDGVTLFVPLTVFETILGALGPFAKGMAFAGTAAGAILIGGVAGVLFGRAGTRASDAVFVGGVAWFLAEFVVLPIAGAGFFGFDRGAPFSLQGPLLIGAAVYGFLFTGIRRELAGPERGAVAPAGTGPSVPAGAGPPDTAAEPSDTPMPVLPRRRFVGGTLTLLGIGALVGAAGSVGAQVLIGARKPIGGQPGTDVTGFGPTPALTPVDDFYRVDKNLIPPSVDGASWRLTIDGLVDRPQSYSAADLKGKPRQEMYRTLECISYQVVPGDDLISNQRWGGVRMSDLLDDAGVQASARFLLFEAADGYTESMPLEVARDPLTWIADEMGPPGTPLLAAHGFPARVLIAGRFGMKQPKWLTHIQLAEADIDGYWEQRGWDKQAVVVTMSRIDWPRPNDEVPAGKAFTVYGIANAGNRGISRVELSTDDGQTWHDAELEPLADPLGPLTWVRWRVSVTVADAGTVRLAVRATDGKRAVQDGEPRAPLPSGATGWHRVRLVATTGSAAPQPPLEGLARSAFGAPALLAGWRVPGSHRQSR